MKKNELSDYLFIKSDFFDKRVNININMLPKS